MPLNVTKTNRYDTDSHLRLYLEKAVSAHRLHHQMLHDIALCLYFFSHGLRYLDRINLEGIARLQAGDILRLKREDHNEADRFALVLETDEKLKVGYCPRYLTIHWQKKLNQKKSVQGIKKRKAVFP
ncbi:MAG: hypothetical protein D3906_03220 [Candidatus Electrothrix sp. AUS1_2]|nr:hypothetical protein [Candidatus Electrothrix sp. AUS1_2]